MPTDKKILHIKTIYDYAHWNWMCFGVSADFLEYYADKYPEPPENPSHSDLATILASLRQGEQLARDLMRELLEREKEVPNQ